MFVVLVSTLVVRLVILVVFFVIFSVFLSTLALTPFSWATLTASVSSVPAATLVI